MGVTQSGLGGVQAPRASGFMTCSQGNGVCRLRRWSMSSRQRLPAAAKRSHCSWVFRTGWSCPRLVRHPPAALWTVWLRVTRLRDVARGPSWGRLKDTVDAEFGLLGLARRQARRDRTRAGVEFIFLVRHDLGALCVLV